MAQESAAYRQKLGALQDELAARFGADDLRTLCFKLGIDYDDLPGESKQGKARELVVYCVRVSRLHELVSLCSQQRPNGQWPAFSPSELTPSPPIERPKVDSSPSGTDTALRIEKATPQPEPAPSPPPVRLLGLVMIGLVALDVVLALVLAWRFLGSEPNALAYIQAMAGVLALILQSIGLLIAFGVRHIELQDLPVEIVKRIWLCGIIVVMTAVLIALVLMPATVCVKMDVGEVRTDITVKAGKETIFKGTALGVVDVCVPSSYSGQNIELKLGANGYISRTETIPVTPGARYNVHLTPVPTFVPTPTPTPAVVALRAWSGMYVTVTDITTTGKLKAKATQIGEQQKFTLLCLANGKAAFQISNRFVSALNDEADRNWELRAVMTERLAWEEFTLVNPDTQVSLSCVQVLKQLQQSEVGLAFRTFHNKFVTAMGQDADWVLRAETTVLDKYEKFTAINLASTPTVVVDTMDSLAGWTTFDDSLITVTTRSIINISSVQGMVNNAIRISYDLKPERYFVGISKVITPGLLSGTQGLKFRYKGSEPSNTLELKLLYAPHDGKGEVFSFAQRETVGGDRWETFEQLYDMLGCGETCTSKNQKLDPARVWKMDIAVSHQQGGAPGPGSVIVDQVEAIRPSTVCPTQRDYRCLQGTMTPVATGASDTYCAETVTLPQPTLAYTVYISMMKRALENFGYSLYEVEAYGPGNSQTNLLREGTVAASSTEDGRYIAPYAIDGNLLTRWASAKCCKYGNCSQDDKGNLICDNPEGSDPQWLEITLPTPAIIDRIVLKWEQAYATEYCVIVTPAK